MKAGHPERNVNRWAVSSFVERVARKTDPGDLILDAGAGEGQYRPLFEGRRYVAVDLAVGDPEWDYRGVDVLADLTLLPFETGSFDHVLCTQTLEHLAEPLKFLSEAARVLRPGGTLHLTAPQCFRLHQEPHDYYRYTRYGLVWLTERAGLTVGSIEPQGGLFWFLADNLRPLHRRLFGSERHIAWRILTAPIALASKVVLTTLLPLVFFRVDFLDGKKTMTTGHEVTAVKEERGAD